MAKRGIAVGIYQNRNAAQAVLRKLRRRGFRRSAAIHSSSSGRIHVSNYRLPPRHLALVGGGAGFVLGLLLAVYVHSQTAAFLLLHLTLGLCVLTLTGAVGGWYVARWLDFGVPSRLIVRYRRWVIRNEILTLVEVSPEDLHPVLELLRQVEGDHPLTFVFYPEGDLGIGPDATFTNQEPITAERLDQQARQLAAGQQVTRRVARGRPLLQRLRTSERALKHVRQHLSEAVRLDQSILLSGEWLLDNGRIIQGHIDAFQRGLPRNYYAQLPVLTSGPRAGLPRVYEIACELVTDTDARLDRDNLNNFLQSYQSVVPLTIGELWALPLMLRLRLIEHLHALAIEVDRRQRERERADFWANRLVTAARREPDQLLALVAEMAREEPTPSAHLADQLVGHLYDEDAALASVRSWLERKLSAPLAECLSREQRVQTVEQISLGNAISSLRRLEQLDWSKLFERVSRVDAVLWTDPAGVYPEMDFATRDRYRHTVEEVSRRSNLSEIDVALKALELANASDEPILSHVGYYLIDEGRETLEAQVGYRVPVSQELRRWVLKHPAPVYLGSLAIMTVCILTVVLGVASRGGTGPILGVLGALALLPASELAIQIVNYLVTRLLPPRVLPKMSFEQGIPDTFRTLVVVPMMLLTPESIRDEVERLEVRYLANPDSNLRFALLSDFSDAPQQRMLEDEERLDVVVHAIEQLDVRYGPGFFFLFHRERQWCESEQKWIGWERKRGKLEHLNRFLMGDAGPELDNLLCVGEAQRLRDIRFVITLDSDTQLPRDTGRRLVETLAHPLNQPYLAMDGSRVVRGYTILQPRVSSSLPSATASYFSRLFTDPTGVDPYTRAVSDVYQDLAGEGSYHGKGIYDLRAFHQVLSGRFPEAHLLSHDLIEGVHVRVGYVSDIELFDLFPRDYLVYTNRQHRWIRGDWQIADWLLPTVPAGDGTRVPNPLDALSRWKIFDNLRRSLLPVACVLLLLVGWLLSPAPALWSWLVAAVLFLPPMLQIVQMLTTRWQSDPLIWRDLGLSWVRAGITMALMPHQALVAVDAIARVWHRRLRTHRKLLEWETAYEAHRRAANRHALFLRRLTGITLVFCVFSLALTGLRPAAEPAAQLFLGLWIIIPLLVAWLNTGRRRRPADALTAADRAMLRLVARQTWRFFDDFVGEQTHWLPPDNYQVVLQVEMAPRTSPTNIGFWLLSNLAACDLGYSTPDESVDRVLATFKTLDRLECYEGHLLNWYDINTLEPLQPRYVSMVDSGNLLGALWALAQGCQEMLERPILSLAALHGLADTLALLRQTLATEPMPDAKVDGPLSLLEQLCAPPPADLEILMRRLRSARAPAHELAALCEQNQGRASSACYWAQALAKQVMAWNALLDRYLLWVEHLTSLPDEGLVPLGRDVHDWRRQALAEIPSLRVLANGQIPGLTLLRAAKGRLEAVDLPETLCAWLDQLEKLAATSQWLAGERLAQAESILVRSNGLAAQMNMRFLYHPERKVFSIGYNVNEKRQDNSYYDLLGSEARLGSFVSIARGEIPVEHWFALGRPFASAYGQRVLLSWSGTMFEYLMPLLLTRSYENSLLDEACRAVVVCQIAYGKQRGIPWGISEAAFSALDSRQIFQYQAFGVPGLGLKRGLAEDLVVAPYASALALLVYPRSAVQNLKRLADASRRGLRGDYGYYESIDYTRQHGPHGERGVLVQTYMAHHQGMILLSIDNVLNNNVFQTRFHADPRVRATESLLYERVPIAPALLKEYVREAPTPRVAALPGGAMSSRIDTWDTPTPRTHLLSNGTYSVMITQAGSGYSRWRDIEITRWRADTTRDSWGTFCYLKDVETSVVWSATYQPVGTKPARYSVLFTPEKVEFRRQDFGIEALMEVTVSPEDNAEIRRITLINHSMRFRMLELTSYAEVALAPHNADRAHPAFSKLFVQTEALPKANAVLAWRRPRSAKDVVPWAAHVSAMKEESQETLSYETDRARFLGRGRTAAAPAALEGSLSNTAGAILDPAFSLRRRVTLEPGQRVSVAFITAAGESREEVVALAEKYCDLKATGRAFEMAWTHAQLELRRLRIQPDEALRYQQLASYMLYPKPALRPPPDRLRRNTLGQSRLWAYGISGDFPIIVVTTGDTNDIETVRQILLAHTYWHEHGLKADLVILNEEAVSYEQPLQDQLRRMINAYSQFTGADQPGGVFLRPAGLMPEEDLTLLLTVARVVLVVARGSLSQQLATPVQPKALPPAPASRRRMAEEPSPPLPFMELPYFNGLGGFTLDGREYAIYLGPGDQTPAPWINVMANPTFGTLVSESGCGFTWYGNSQSNRLTPWSNDPVSDPPGDALYICDEDLGVFWTPTPLPIRELDAYRTRHGQGYTIFEHNSHAIEQELVTFVPVDDRGGAPVRIQRLRLRNRSSRHRRLTITAYVEWALGVEREDMQMHVVTSWDVESQALLARNAYHPDFGTRLAFAASHPPAVAFAGDRTEFLGRNGTYAAPAAIGRTRLSGRVGAGLDPCGAQQVTVEIEPGQQAEVIFLLGQGADVSEVRPLVQRFRDPARVEQALQTTREWWDRILGVVQVETPDLAVDFLLNRWLLYQDLSCRIWGRSAFYQSGGAYGFRDQLQDVMALLYADPNLAREQILHSAARQFVEGDVQHWWHPPSGAGVRTRISDDLLWLPFVTAQYVRVTGDAAILDETVPFLEGKVLEPQEQEAFFVPTVSEQSAPLLEHCRRAIEKGSTAGPHGLPLIGAGDWNDGLNRVGIEGRGESIWLAWFLIHVWNDFAALLEGRKDASAQGYRERAAQLAKNVEAQAWDGRWYRRAYFDDGTPLGSEQSEEAKIDSLPQSWATISGAADPQRAEAALQAVEEHLVSTEYRLVRLFTPPFDKTPHDPGYIKGYLPGVRENGGQYTHGSLWIPLAFARRGEGDRAVSLLRLMSPIEHSHTPEEVARYKVEPYVVAADIYMLEGQEGRGGWTWYTGSAGWMYRVWIEEILGLKKRGDTLSLSPVLPAEWPGFRLHYRYQDTDYEITVERAAREGASGVSVEIDGKLMQSLEIPLRNDGKTHTVHLRLDAKMPAPPGAE
jgi:cyclic beta-1,2-glucan synthetase